LNFRIVRYRYQNACYLPGDWIGISENLTNFGKETISVNVRELSEKFNLHVAAGQKHLDRQIQGGYCGDLLSDVMANAPNGCIWLTVQTHQNIVAVAVLHEMAAIILTGGQEPDQETIEKAEEEGIPILMWPQTAYDLAGKAHAAGIPDS
jgi:predicted transcriptional regulator